MDSMSVFGMNMEGSLLFQRIFNAIFKLYIICRKFGDNVVGLSFDTIEHRVDGRKWEKFDI